MVKKDMSTNKHKLWDVDVKLFASMKGNYLTVNEENFFKNMQYKQEYDNDDEIYVVMEYNEEYDVGHGIGTDGAQEEHVMILSEALALNLKELGLIGRNTTLWERLRECDYNVVL